MNNTDQKLKSSVPVKKIAQISVMAFAIMNVTTIVSLRGMPSQAEYGLTSIFYYVLASILFLIPVSLVAAELASTFPQKGGVFRWVGEAFGPRWGFAAIYYQWQAVVIWFPTVLIFGGVAIAYIFMPSLASNKWYMVITLLAVYWIATFNTFRGIRSSARLSTLGGLFGTIIPGALLILLAIIYLCMREPVYLPLDKPFFPDLSNVDNLVLATGIFLFFAGMEMQAVHVQEMKNPTRNYPLSILIATVITIAIFILCTLAVGVVIPEKDINLTQSLLVAYNRLWACLGVPWMGNVMAVLLAFGVLGQVSAIIAGPSTGLLSVGKAGYLPRSLQKTNKNGIQVPILIIQGAFVTILTFVITVLPSVQSAYQILSQLANIIYLSMYIIMYIAVLQLRRTQPHIKRPFRIPGGNWGVWVVGLLGLFGAVVATILSFVPPTQISTGSPAVYVGILIACTVFFLVIPFVIYACKKKSWDTDSDDFEPFTWQVEGRRPSEIAKLDSVAESRSSSNTGENK